MRQLPTLTALAAALALAACAPSETTEPDPTADACGASAAQAAVGATSADAEPILRQASEAAGGTYRIVEHDQVTTMEFLEDRLTARVGRDGLIETVGCG